MRIYDLEEIRSAIDLGADLKALLNGQKRAFISASQGQYETPLPLLLSFQAERGDCHVKAAYRKDGVHFVIKMVSGFYRNTQKGLPGGDGALMICSQKTGLILAILHDRGFLTTLRTALAAALLARITPWKINSIGIIGTGALAQQVINVLSHLYPRASFFLWGRDQTKAKTLIGNKIQICATATHVLECADIVVTTTASTTPIINSLPIGKKIHIIALGSDDTHKNECSPHLFKQADMVIVDSKKQAALMGETFHAARLGYFSMNDALELGAILDLKKPLQSSVMISSLSGIAAQDLEIADFLLDRLST